MSLQFSPYAIPLLVAAVASLGFAWYALGRRQRAEALIFGLMMIGLCWWSLLYALHICATDPETQYLFNRLKYIGVVLIPPLWLTLAIQHTQRQSPGRWLMILIFLPAMFLLPVALTDHWTHLWWSETWLEAFNGQTVMRSMHAPLYWVHLATGYAFVTLGLWLYVRLYRRTGQVLRRQAVLMIGAAAIPLVGNVLTQVGLSPMPWGLDSFFFTLGGALLAVAIFRYRFLDIVPVASQAVVEQIPEGVIVADADGYIIDLNPAASRLIGAGRHESIGRPLASAVGPPELGRAVAALVQQGLEQPAECEAQIAGANNPRTLSLSATPLSHPTAGQVGHIILLSDISDRVAARAELEELYRQAEIERERLALTIRTVNDAIVLLDTEGRILASNPTAQQILNAEQSSEFPAPLRAMLDQAQATDGVTETEIEIEGQYFHVTAAPVAGTGLALTMHDVTHFQQLARLKDEFVRTVSHDLRTPLASIRGYAQLALRQRTSEQKRREALERIDRAVTRMSALISDLLDLATVEAGVSYDTELVRLDKMARAAIRELEGAALARGLEIRCDLTETPVLEADPRLITQMWRNLIDNAIKYTDQGTVSIQVQVKGNLLLGRVTDTGIGISPADLPYVFDKFFRAKSPYPRDATGTGLGLSLVKTIVETYGGRVWAESQVGIGSTFGFSLPLESDAAGTDTTVRSLD